LELADAGQVQPLFANWEVVRYLTSYVPWPYPPNGAETFYRERALPRLSLRPVSPEIWEITAEEWRARFFRR